MFENIKKFFKKSNKKETLNINSRDTAKERLHLVLMQDRANVSADFLDLMRQEIIEVIKKYIDIDESAMDVRLTNQAKEDGTQGAPALYANIPILNIKDENKKLKKEAENEEKQKQNEETPEIKEKVKDNTNEEKKNKKVTTNAKEKKNKEDKAKKIEENNKNSKENKKEEKTEDANKEKEDEMKKQEEEKIEEAKKIVEEENSDIGNSESINVDANKENN